MISPRSNFPLQHVLVVNVALFLGLPFRVRVAKLISDMKTCAVSPSTAMFKDVDIFDLVKFDSRFEVILEGFFQ